MTQLPPAIYMAHRMAYMAASSQASHLTFTGMMKKNSTCMSG